MNNIKPFECVEGLRSFITRGGGVNLVTNWCDWDIPLHWGGVSDPFQPIERRYRNSYECLKVFAETKYPFIVSSKGILSAEPEYLELLQECNCVYQISMVCAKYDVLEQGAPSFEERITIAKRIVPKVKRLIVRVQPYMHEVLYDVLENLAKFRDLGAYGVIIEGIKFFTNKQGLVKVGADYCYPYKLIREDFLRLKDKAHSLGLSIYAGENRIRALGDSLSCCGAEGVKGFRGNHFNLNHILNGDFVEPTLAQKQTGTAGCFKAIYQDTKNCRMINKLSFSEMMLKYYSERKPLLEEIFGLRY